MQINNDPKISSFRSNDRPLSLKEGDIYQGAVKEKLPNNEAILQIKGQDLKVKIDGTIPESGRVSIKLTNTNQATPTATIAQTADTVPKQTKAEIGKIVDQLQLPSSLSEQVKKAANVLTDNGIPVPKETLHQIARFLEKGMGTFEQKLETITAMAKKKLEFTPVQMKAVHEALHGKTNMVDFIQEMDPTVKKGVREILSKIDTIFKGNPSIELQEKVEQVRQALKVSDLVKAISILKKIDPAITKQAEPLYFAAGKKLTDAIPADQALLANVKKMLQQGSSIQEIVQLLKGKLPAENSSLLNDAMKIENYIKNSLLKEINSLMPEEKPSQTSNLDLVIKALKKEPNIGQVLSFMQEQLMDTDSLSTNQTQKLQQTMDRVGELAEKGRELAARQELMNTLTHFQRERNETISQPTQTNTYEFQDDFLAALPLASKDLIVTTITKKLSQAAIDFKEIKRGITKNLQSIQQLLDQNRSVVQAKPLLEATIKQLDQAILKSDFMLYTDMTTEKKLLTASGQLAEARKLLEKGDHPNASKIVAEVKNTMEKLMFKPSDVRVKHFVSKELFQLESPSLTKQLGFTMDQSMEVLKQDPSGRQVFEHMKSLGLTYEADQARALLTKGQEMIDPTLKDALLKLTQSNVDQATSQKAEQVVNQLTGQQLLSKTDTSTLQSMMFVLPFLLQEKAEQVKVFVNSKSEGQQVDWENCSLYFLLDTKKMGEVGILLSAVDRNLSVTVKSDRPGFKEKMEPLVTIAKDRLKEIGYQIGQIQFTKLTVEQEEIKKEPTAKPNLPTFKERGYDFTV